MSMDFCFIGLNENAYMNKAFEIMEADICHSKSLWVKFSQTIAAVPFTGHVM
jgi:hypothetical protein